MSNRGIITSGQLFVLLYISRAIVTITYSPMLINGDSMWQHLLSALISLPLTLIMLVPVILLYKHDSKMSVLEQSQDIFKGFSYVIIILYALYFLLVACYTMTVYNVFLTEAVNNELPLVPIAIAVLTASCYGAFKGIEALARASGIILVGIILTMLLMIIALSQSIDTTNYRSVLEADTASVTNGCALMLSRMACIPALGVLYPVIKGKVARGSVVFTAAVYITILVFIILVTGSLGDYLKYSVFPVYQAAKTVNIDFLQRLDALYLGLWTTGLFCKISLFLYLVSLCIGKAFGRSASRYSIVIGGAIVFLVSILLSKDKFSSPMFNTVTWLWVTLSFGFFFPLLLYICVKVKSGRGKHTSKASLKKAGKALKVFSVVFCAVIAAFSFSGCIPKTHLNERLIVEGIGIDKHDDKYTLTLMLMNTDIDEQNPPPGVMTTQGYTVAEAISNAFQNTGKEVLLSHNKFIIMNESAAENASAALSYFDADFEARPDIYLYVTPNKAADIVANEKILSSMTADDIASISQSTSVQTAVSSCRLMDFVSSLNNGYYDVCIPIIEVSGDKAAVEPNGSAVFKSGKLEGIISADETLAYKLMTESVQKTCINIVTDKGKTIAVSLSDSKADISTKLSGDRIVANINVKLTAGTPTHKSADNSEVISKTEDYIENICTTALQKSYSRYNSDILKIGKRVIKDNPGFFEGINKVSTYPKDILFSVKITVSMT